VEAPTVEALIAEVQQASWRKQKLPLPLQKKKQSDSADERNSWIASRAQTTCSSHKSLEWAKKHRLFCRPKPKVT
jgi:hypothetical protein